MNSRAIIERGAMATGWTHVEKNTWYYKYEDGKWYFWSTVNQHWMHDEYSDNGGAPDPAHVRQRTDIETLNAVFA